ncbi:ketopantoate reductase family protein [Cohnella sp.]|uniref:ketopantoate reductase family protein n=1 Tax=Cohnella sp. TaxID=1883426 RepID=UPI00370479ED
MKITIVGAGAIGGILGAHLVRAGHDITFVEAQREHVQAIRENGLKVSGEADFVVHPRILLPEEVNEPLETVLLAVKARHTAPALEPLAKHLTPGGYVLSLQNGLEEYKIARIVGEERTVGAFLTFGGHYVQPGEVSFGGTGSFCIGEMDGRTTPRLNELEQVLSALQPIKVTDNIFGFLWGKAAVGAVYFATALVSEDVPDIFDRLEYRGVLGSLAGEVVKVCQAEGVVCEVIDGFDPKIFAMAEPPEGAVNACWQAQKTYWYKHDQRRTGVWRDLAIHRRPTEVNEIVGPVVQRAQEKSIAVPRLECLVRLIKEAERGERELTLANLDELRELDRQLGQMGSN